MGLCFYFLTVLSFIFHGILCVGVVLMSLSNCIFFEMVFIFLFVAKHAAPLWCDDEWWLRIICTLFVVICTLFIQSICLFLWMVFNRKLEKTFLSVCFVAKHAAPLWCDGVCGLRHPLGVSLQQANRKYANNFNQKIAELSEFDLWEIFCWKRTMIVIAEAINNKGIYQNKQSKRLLTS